MVLKKRNRIRKIDRKDKQKWDEDNPYGKTFYSEIRGWVKK